MMAAGKPQGGAKGKASRRRSGRLRAPLPPARRFGLSLCAPGRHSGLTQLAVPGERGSGGTAAVGGASSVGLSRAGRAARSGPALGGCRGRLGPAPPGRWAGRGGAGRPQAAGVEAGSSSPARSEIQWWCSWEGQRFPAVGCRGEGGRERRGWHKVIVRNVFPLAF